MHLRCAARRSPVVTRFAHCASPRHPLSHSCCHQNTPVCTRFARLDWGYEKFNLSEAASTEARSSCSPLKTEGLSAFSNSQRNSAALREKTTRLRENRPISPCITARVLLVLVMKRMRMINMGDALTKSGVMQ